MKNATTTETGADLRGRLLEAWNSEKGRVFGLWGSPSFEAEAGARLSRGHWTAAEERIFESDRALLKDCQGLRSTWWLDLEALVNRAGGVQPAAEVL